MRWSAVLSCPWSCARRCPRARGCHAVGHATRRSSSPTRGGLPGHPGDMPTRRGHNLRSAAAEGISREGVSPCWVPVDTLLRCHPVGPMLQAVVGSGPPQAALLYPLRASSTARRSSTWDSAEATKCGVPRSRSASTRGTTFTVTWRPSTCEGGMSLYCMP